MLKKSLFLALALGCSSKSTAFVDPVDGSTSLIPKEDGGCTGFGCEDAGNTKCDDPVACASPPSCDAGAETTIVGKVWDPGGKNPVYNAIVYIPGSAVAPFGSEAACEACGQVSGVPVRSAITGPDGQFELKNTPAGKNVPLVIQVGRWRRQIRLPEVKPCVPNRFESPAEMRLPKNKTEGEIPRIAIATGGADGFECLMRKMGIEDSEVTGPSGAGRIHLWAGNDGSPPPGGTRPASELWADLGTLKKYDLVINACEAGEFADTKPQAAIDNLVAYANLGGRVFLTHYHYYWIDPSKYVGPEPKVTSPWSSTAEFRVDPRSFPESLEVSVDTSFPKGQAFADWLYNVRATSTRGTFTVIEPRKNAVSTNPPSVRWLHGTWPDDPTPALMHYTFNTPVGKGPGEQCGKVLYSDFHVTTKKNPPIGGPLEFPTECDSPTFEPQEKALEFMLFDLTSCIQKDTEPPAVPR